MWSSPEKPWKILFGLFDSAVLLIDLCLLIIFEPAVLNTQMIKYRGSLHDVKNQLHSFPILSRRHLALTQCWIPSSLYLLTVQVLPLSILHSVPSFSPYKLWACASISSFLKWDNESIVNIKYESIWQALCRISDACKDSTNVTALSSTLITLTIFWTM